MKIEWNRVTWYSKAVAVVVFVATFALAFWLGMLWNQAYQAGLGFKVADSDSPRPTDRVQYVAPNLLLGPDADATVGNFVIGFNGEPVYTYALDNGTTSHCNGACTANWLPYTIAQADVANAMTAIESPLKGTAGTAKRLDGSLQVTYDGKPLYFYKGDVSGEAPKGQKVSQAWSLVSYSTSTPPKGILPYNSGIRGTVMLGPTCPVEKVPVDPACADKPYSTLVAIFHKSDPVHAVALLKSGADGTYSVSLPPGDYTVGAGESNLPRCGQVSATVGASGYATADISCDTGIR